ncbi:MAG: hypothetical protein KatS3mg078_1592 [Deltaproteobacteria bacterium]|nr:MAG: hypothetical protein KatS3mg078_1592 [Deltaproteobacteria bacterium]
MALTTTVEVEEPIQGRVISDIRALVLSRALKTAIEEAALKIEPDLTGVDLKELLDANPTDYVRSYRILSEYLTENSYRVSLEVELDQKKIESLIEGKGLKAKSGFQVSITTREEPDSNPVVKAIDLSEIKGEITRLFKENGYKVVKNGDINLDVYVSVKTTTTFEDTPTYSALGKVHIKALNRKNEQIAEITQSSFQQGYTLETVALSALKEAAQKAAEKMVIQLGGSNHTQGEENKTIEILFLGFRDYKQYEQIDDILNKVIPTGIAKRVIGSGNRASFFTASNTTPDKLAKLISLELISKGLPFKLKDVYTDKIVFGMEQ